MSSGWIKLWRKLLESDMYQSLTSAQRDVMITCLLLANHSTKQWEWKGEIFQANPGQFITSLESLRQKCGKDISIRNIRTAIDKLEKWEFLTNESTKTGRLITVVNWESYQREEEKRQSNRQTSDKQVTTNKNDKECIRSIYSFWNSLSHTITHRKLTSPMKKAINARLQHYSTEELKTAMNNYNQVISNSEYWFSYSKWTLADFLSQGEGKQVDRFLSGIEDFRRTPANGQQENNLTPAQRRARENA